MPFFVGADSISARDPFCNGTTGFSFDRICGRSKPLPYREIGYSGYSSRGLLAPIPEGGIGVNRPRRLTGDVRLRRVKFAAVGK